MSRVSSACMFSPDVERHEGDPTPEQIRETCEATQGSLNPLERILRSGRRLWPVDIGRYHNGRDLTTWQPPLARNGGGA